MFRRLLILIGFVALPVLVNPWSVDPFEIDKITLVRVMGVISFSIMIAHARSLWAWLKSIDVRDPGFWLLLLLAWTTLSCAYSAYPTESIWGSLWRGGGLITLGAVVCIFFALRLMPLTAHDRRFVAWCGFFTFVGTSVLAIAQYLTNAHLYLPIPLITTGAPYQLLRPAATFGHPLYFGIFLAITVPLLVYLWRSYAHRFIQLTIVFGACLGAVALYLTRARSAIIALCLAAAVLAVRRHRMRTPGRWILGSVGILLLIGIALTQSSAIRASLLRTPSLIVRWHEWRFATVQLMQSPFFGYGPETYDAYSISRVRAPGELQDGLADRVHNLVLDTTWNSGVVGLVFWILLFLTALRVTSSDEWSHITMACLIAYLVVMQFAFDYSYTYFFLAFILAQRSQPIVRATEPTYRLRVLGVVCGILLCAPIILGSVAGVISRRAELAAGEMDYDREVQYYQEAHRLAPYWRELREREEDARKSAALFRAP